MGGLGVVETFIIVSTSLCIGGYLFRDAERPLNDWMRIG